MVSLDELVNLRTDALHTAADQWSAAADQLAAHGADFATNVAKPVGGAAWDGVAATAASKHLDQLTSTFASHAERLRSISTTLHTGAASLGTAQTALRGALDSARQFGITFGADGSVTIDPAVVLRMITDPTEQAAIPRLVSQFGNATTRAERAATETDRRTAAALRQHADPAGRVTAMMYP